MMPETDYNVLPVGSETAVSDGSGRTDAYRSQLEEAHFAGSFMAAVCASLELDGICSIAARALYDHAAYDRIVFAFSTDIEVKTVTFSPVARNGMPADRPEITVGAPDSPSPVPGSPLASVHFGLPDNLGAISIYYQAGQDTTFSDSLRGNIAASFSQAIRNALQHRAMKDLAMRDGLTGLFNRRSFDETLAQRVKCPGKRPVSLILVDLDDFKQVNDTFGHPSGDRVLKTFGKILKECCRGHDLIARFGGEEFAVILSRTTAVTAHAVAQRIRSRLEKEVFVFDGRRIRITASIGLSTCRDGNAGSASNLVEKADQALYHAKMTGKNKVCMSPRDVRMDSRCSACGGNFGSLASAGC